MYLTLNKLSYLILTEATTGISGVLRTERESLILTSGSMAR